jgi:hypothetical protein
MRGVLGRKWSWHVRYVPTALQRLYVGGPPASAHVLDWCWCCPQAVDLNPYATHEEQVDVMLGAITKARRGRVAVCPGWETTEAGCRLAKYEAAWTAFRSAKFVKQHMDRPGRPAVMAPHRRMSRRKGEDAAADNALVVTLSKVHAQLRRIADANERVGHYGALGDRLGTLPLSRREASYVAREESRAAALERMPPWTEGGRCPCAPHESCGQGCPNYVMGAQAAWYELPCLLRPACVMHVCRSFVLAHTSLCAVLCSPSFFL